MGRAVRLTKINIIAAAIAVLLAVPGGLLLLNRSSGQTEESSQHTQEVASIQTEAADTEIGTDYVKFPGESGKTALELLQTHTEVETEDSDFGEFVTSVNGQDGGGDKYWLYYVDGQEASVGAGEYQTKDSETIEWKLQ